MKCGLAILTVALALTAGCAAKKDYSKYFAHEPRSILVVPPLNETTAIDAEPVYMTTVSRPLAERGFYVFPIQLTQLLLRDLGMPEAGLIHQLPHDRFREHFGADAVLFVTIEDWSNRYSILDASTVVTVSFVMKDTRSGETIWQNKQSAVRSSGSGGGGLIGMMIQAAITYAVNELMEVDYRPLAQQVNAMAFSPPASGLPFGPYHPDFGKDRDQYMP